MEEPTVDILNGRKMSEILVALPQGFSSKDVITIRELRDSFSGRIYGALLFILALPNLIPFPIPGLSTITGLPLLIVTMQLVFSMKKPWFPKAILNLTIKTQHLNKVCSHALPYLHKIEHFILPRMFWLVRYPADRCIAIVCVLLSVVIMLPLPLIPFSNSLPALAICMFAIAILQRDGLFVIIGILFAVASIVVITGILSTIIMTVLHFWRLG